MTFENFDAGRPAQDCSKEWRVVDVGVASEGGVEGQEALHLFS
jgi:hypothetical protein